MERVKTRNQLHTICGSLGACRLLEKCSLIERTSLVQEIHYSSELEGTQPELHHSEPECRLEDQKPVGNGKLKISAQPGHAGAIPPGAERRSTGGWHATPRPAARYLL